MISYGYNKFRKLVVVVCLLLFIVPGCSDIIETRSDIERETTIPETVSKRGPLTDRHPPILHSDDYEQPVPLPYPINTAGLEDSPFVLPDGETLYFFFTPDARIPPEKQVLDGVSGIWVSHKEGECWSKPKKVWLQDSGKLALDGAVCIQDDEMWFASAREGYTGVNMFTAKLSDDGKWIDWQYVGDRLMKQIKIGEVHLHGDDLYFHSDRDGGKGGNDIWITTRDGKWSDPVSFEAVNSESDDGFPFMSTDGNEFWFTRTYLGTPGIFRTIKVNGAWTEPELIVSQFAGEPTLDDEGNLYFVHHYFENGVMIEADIYVAYKRQ